MHKGIIIASLACVLPTPVSAREPSPDAPATPVVAASAVVAPAPVVSYAAPVVRHWPSRALPDQPTMAQRLQVAAPVKRAGKGWTISD